MDSDTFALDNVDELFCLPMRFAASKRPHVPVEGKANFNSGTFVFTPSNETYNDLLQKATEFVGSWENGEQTLLNRYFGPTMTCYSVGYNCVGFGSTEYLSTKCQVRTEEQIWRSRKIIHAKLSDRRQAHMLP